MRATGKRTCLPMGVAVGLRSYNPTPSPGTPVCRRVEARFFSALELGTSLAGAGQPGLDAQGVVRAAAADATGRWHQRYMAQRNELLKMEFKRFVNGLIQLSCQIVRTGRRIVYRLLSWNPWVEPLLRLSEAMRKPLIC